MASDKMRSKSFVLCVLTPRITKQGRTSEAAFTRADQYRRGNLYGDRDNAMSVDGSMTFGFKKFRMSKN